jgi:hypothetical protein
MLVGAVLWCLVNIGWLGRPMIDPVRDNSVIREKESDRQLIESITAAVTQRIDPKKVEIFVGRPAAINTTWAAPRNLVQVE